MANEPGLCDRLMDDNRWYCSLPEGHMGLHIGFFGHDPLEGVGKIADDAGHMVELSLYGGGNSQLIPDWWKALEVLAK